MAGAAVIVSLQQLKGLLGIVHFTSKMQMIPVMSSVLNQRDEVIINQNKFILFLFFIFLRNTLDIYTKGAFRYIFF
jgi:sulfate transporter 3